MIFEQPALCLRVTSAQSDLTGINHGKPPRAISARARAVVSWITVWRVVAWLCLIIVIGVALGRALQFGAESVATHGKASEPAQGMGVVYARGACTALDQYVHRTMTIDELHDLQDQLCPPLSGVQATGN